MSAVGAIVTVGAKDAAVEAARDDDLARHDVAFDLAIDRDRQPERGDVAADESQNLKRALDFESAANRYAFAEKGRGKFNVTARGAQSWRRTGASMRT